MRFVTHKRRQPPAVIIVSLIDVLLVVLIFLMVTTTFKKQPAVKLALPESKQSKAGASENAPLVITIPKSGPIYLGTQPLTFEKLQEKLIEAVRQNSAATVSISADEGAPFGQIIKVMDAAKAANVKSVSAFTRGAAKP
jgi:biopolymer transport protein ExbD